MASALKLLFAGTPDFAERHLDALIASQHSVLAVLTQPDRPAGRGKRLQPSPVKQRAEEAGLAVLQPPSLKDAAIQESLKSFAPDVLVVVAYGCILPQAVLDIPRFGCLNVHASLLPRWRGAAPIQRAVEMGDQQSGVTIMQMEAGLDTGPMLAKTTLDLDPKETGGTLHDRLAAAGPPALLAVLDHLEDRLADAEMQNDELANYARKIDKIECELDWQLSAEILERKIRAFNPAPVCFSLLGDERVKIWEASVVATGINNAHPGQILQADKSGIQVACGVDALLIKRAQFPGGKPLSAGELLNGKGAALAPGGVFINPSPAA